VPAKGMLKRGRYLSLDSRDSILTGSFSDVESGGAVDWEAKGLRVRRGIVSVVARVRLRFEMGSRWRRGRDAGLDEGRRRNAGSDVMLEGICVWYSARECVWRWT
jgi:hypothetical protein